MRRVAELPSNIPKPVLARGGSGGVLLLVAALAGAIRAADDAPAPDLPPRPNVVLILVDDMGWSDLGCYGGEIRTPNVDSLAAGGLRFSAFYNTGRCCPTRASLLTGLYPHQAGVGRMTFDRGQPGYRGRLAPHAVTIAEVLRSAGYRTAMVGKWHLSLTQELDGHVKHLNNQVIRQEFSDPATYPVHRGFEEHYGIIWGVVSYFDPFSLVHNTTAVRSVPEDYYITDAFTDHAVEYIEKYSRDGRPFFLYLAHCAPHWPLHALPEDVAKYQETYRVGWQAIREARYRRQVAMGLVDPQTAKLSDPFSADVSWDDNPTRGWDARAMACHAAMIDRVDQGVGRIVAKLRELGELDNTLILFLSDNGASREEPGRPGFDRVSQTRDGRDVTYYGGGKPKQIPPGPETTYAGIGPHWANAANTPFRLFKATQHEGGTRTPLVVHWPQGLSVQPGSVTRQPGHVIDVMATCVELAGAPYPEQHQGRRIVPLEGKSLVPIFRGGHRAGHNALFFEHFGAKAVRCGEWKLVAQPGGPWELYHVAADASETVNLADKHPERVQELAAMWESWAHRTSVFPQPERPAPAKKPSPPRRSG
ncbi:MAG TPA: arylsulfatase [Thermoguttaceae bacterium]|nr:arylsulfatase [Thermoguttaceae bacterium]